MQAKFVAGSARGQQRLSQIPAGLNQKMATAGRWIDNLQCQQPGRAADRQAGSGPRSWDPASRAPGSGRIRAACRTILLLYAPALSAGRTDRLRCRPVRRHGGNHGLQLSAPHPRQRFRCDGRFLLQQSFVDAAQVFHVQRSVMHPHPLTALCRDPDQPIQQDRHGPVTPFKPVQQRCRGYARTAHPRAVRSAVRCMTVRRGKSRTTTATRFPASARYHGPDPDAAAPTDPTPGSATVPRAIAGPRQS